MPVPASPSPELAPVSSATPAPGAVVPAAAPSTPAVDKGPASGQPAPAPVIEAHVQTMPRGSVQDQEPAVVAKELGMQQADRELI